MCSILYSSAARFAARTNHLNVWLYEGFVEPLLFASLAWRALSWCRRTSVRPPDDIEKSVTHAQRPRNSFFSMVANFCYQVQDQVAKLILW